MRTYEVCSVCGLPFSSSEKLRLHKILRHPKAREQRTVCLYVSFQIFFDVYGRKLYQLHRKPFYYFSVLKEFHTTNLQGVSL